MKKIVTAMVLVSVATASTAFGGPIETSAARAAREIASVAAATPGVAFSTEASFAAKAPDGQTTGGGSSKSGHAVVLGAVIGAAAGAVLIGAAASCTATGNATCTVNRGAAAGLGAGVGAGVGALIGLAFRR